MLFILSLGNMSEKANFRRADIEAVYDCTDSIREFMEGRLPKGDEIFDPAHIMGRNRGDPVYILVCWDREYQTSNPANILRNCILDNDDGEDDDFQSARHNGDRDASFPADSGIEVCREDPCM
jgi:hypothetical protein